jgi:hypothetical protein
MNFYSLQPQPLLPPARCPRCHNIGWVCLTDPKSKSGRITRCPLCHPSPDTQQGAPK